MNHYERNRKAVQKGLDRRKEQRADAAQDAAERALRTKCNSNTLSRRKLAEASKKARLLQEEQKRMEGLQRKSRDGKEARYCKSWYKFMIRMLGPMVLAAILLAFHEAGQLTIWVAVPFSIAACVFAIDTFATKFMPCNK